MRKFAKQFRVLGLCGIHVNLTKNVWDSFWAVVDGFLGNRKDDRYEAESVIRENKNPRIAKIAQTRKLGDREKKRIYSI